MSEHRPNSYDEIPYASDPFFQTHPDYLATLATLFGMTPPPVAQCRVLELGCASGGNLIPMALTLPGARFLGVDLSARQVGDGRRRVEALGLANVELRAMDLADVGPDLGQFDYIICHGVYSWVPAAARAKILRVSAENLAEQGVAYVSYNTYPGWHLRGMVREMMGYHARRFVEPQARVQQARGFLDFLAESVRDPDGVYARILRNEAEALRKKSDTYLFHEHLEEVNQPVYFHEFVAEARAEGLQYLQDAFFLGRDVELRPEARATLEQLSDDLIVQEQYLDFLINRRFRRTLLCHDHVRLDRTLSPGRMAAFHVSGSARPRAAHPDPHSTALEEFLTPEGASLSTNNPLIKAVLLALFDAWPRVVPFEALASVVREHLARTSGDRPPSDDPVPRFLGEFLLKAYLSRLVELHVHMPEFAREAGERPLASPLARLQAEEGSWATSLLHRKVELDPLDRLVLRLLDGHRDRAALLDLLAESMASGQFAIQQGDRPVQETGQVRQVLTESIDQSLRRLAGGALLLG